MAFKHPFATNVKKSHTSRTLCGITSILLTAAGFSTSAHAQNTNSIPMTFSGKKVTYNLNTNWVAFQVKTSGKAETTIKGLSTQPALDGNAQALLIGPDVVALRVQNSATAQAKNQLASRLKSATSIQRNLRVFGSDSSPVIETPDAIVRFASNVTDTQKKNLLKKQGAILVGPVGNWAPGAYRVRVSSAKAQATTVANGLLSSGSVTWAHPDLAMQMTRAQVAKPAFIPNDPLFSSQWHLLNNGSGGGVVNADVKATEAWNVTRGGGVKIAIHDDGVDVDHEDLKDRFIVGRAFGDESPDARPRIDDNNHGTSVAGLAVASGHNGKGVSGVAPDAGLIAVRTPYDRGIMFTTAGESLVWPVTQGADIVSCSWGFPSLDNMPIPDALSAAVEYVTTQGRGGKGSLLLFAAGNDNTDAKNALNYDPRVITVAATTRIDKKSSYSNFGSGIDVSAPGGYLNGDMVTTDRTGAKGYELGNYTTGFNGTSAACPVAAGVAGLVLAANPNLTRQQVYDVLTSTADKIDLGGGNYDLNGHSKLYGFGRLNAARAVQVADDLLGAKVQIITPADGAEFDRGELTTADGTTDEKTASVKVGLVRTDKAGKRTAYFNFNTSEWVTLQLSAPAVPLYIADFDDESNTWEKELPELGGGYYEFLAQGANATGQNGKVALSKFKIELIGVNVTSPTINGEYEAGDVSGNLTVVEGVADADATSVGVALIKKNASGQSVYHWDFNAPNQEASNWVALNHDTMMVPASLDIPEGDSVSWNLALPLLAPGKYEIRAQGYDQGAVPGETIVVPFVVESNEGMPINIALTPTKGKVAAGKLIAFKGTFKHEVNNAKLTEFQFRARTSDSPNAPTIKVRYDVVNNVVSIYNATSDRWLNGYAPGTKVVIKSDIVDLDVRNCKVVFPKVKKGQISTQSIAFTFAIVPRVSGLYETAIGSASKIISSDNNSVTKGTLTVTAPKSSGKGSLFDLSDAGKTSIEES
jgi:thermitase